jgi:hypothetical protein
VVTWRRSLGGLLLWHVASIFMLLLACWRLSGLCFPSKRAHWGSVAPVASVLSIPVAGTSLHIMDQCLNPRNLPREKESMGSGFCGGSPKNSHRCRFRQGSELHAHRWGWRTSPG